MKANHQFLHANDDAVSPVIAVILMVAITVVLAATVYVWVSGFGANSSQPAKSIALSSAGVIANPGAGNYSKSYTVASASPGMKYQDVSLVLAGSPLSFAHGCQPSATSTPSEWGACAGPTTRVATDLVQAGDTIVLARGTSPSSATLALLDPASNSVMLTLTVS